MGEIVLAVFKWTVRISFWGIMVATWITLTSFVVSNILLPINGSLISDIFAMVQIWAPFNVSSVVAWVLVSSSAYITYRMATIAYGFLNVYIGEK